MYAIGIQYDSHTSFQRIVGCVDANSFDTRAGEVKTSWKHTRSNGYRGTVESKERVGLY